MITTDSAVVTSRSWSAASHALCGRFFPIYWPHTTAPPVAIAVNMLIRIGEQVTIPFLQIIHLLFPPFSYLLC